jgi:nitrile hydratase
MTTHHHDHDHGGHGHAHPHPTRPDHDDRPVTYHQRLEGAVRELLIEKGILTAAEITRAIERMDARTPAQGARIVARAWSDPAYKERLLAKASDAVAELGIEPGNFHLIVVENTERVHNLVVCTLCSCYPRAILGLPPDWYKSRSYRSRAVREPRSVLAEFGTVVPDGVEVRVHDSTADMRYLVLPKRPKGTDNWTEARLAEIATRDTMIGVTVPEIG